MLLAGFRFSAGTDSMTYRNFYREVGTETMAKTVKRITDGEMEPTIVVLARAGNAMHLDASFMFIFFAGVTLIAFYYTSRNFSKNNYWLYYSLILFMVFPDSLNIMRQVAAISLQALALSNIMRKPKWSGIVLLSLFSVSLHYSSVLLLPVLFVPAIVKHIHGRSLVLIMTLLLAIFLLAFPLMIDFASSIGILSKKHLLTLLTTGGSLVNIKFIGALFLAIIYLLNYRRERDKIDKTLGVLMLVGTIYSAVGFYSGYVGRLANFFWVFIVIAGTKLILKLCEKPKNQAAIVLGLGVVYFVIYYAIIGLNEIVPYSFV